MRQPHTQQAIHGQQLRSGALNFPLSSPAPGAALTASGGPHHMWHTPMASRLSAMPAILARAAATPSVSMP